MLKDDWHIDLDLEPDSDLSITQVDAAAASTPTFQYTILEGKRKAEYIASHS